MKDSKAAELILMFGKGKPSRKEKEIEKDEDERTG